MWAGRIGKVMAPATGGECGPAAAGRLSACLVAEDRVVTRSNLSLAALDDRLCRCLKRWGLCHDVRER